MLKKITSEEFQELVLNKNYPVILDFSGEYCGPCKKLAPVLTALSEELSGKAEFYEVDAGEEPVLAQQNGVMSLPTILIFKGGSVKDRIVGMTTREKLLKKITPLL